MKKHFDREIHFGTYLLSEWVEALDCEDIEEGVKMLNKNPFKQIAKLVEIGINSSADLTGADKITTIEAFQLVDKSGGIKSDLIEAYLTDFFDSIQVKPQGKQKAKARGKK